MSRKPDAAAPASRVVIIGAGRMGTGIGNVLREAGDDVVMLGRDSTGWAEAARGAELVLIATPDDAIPSAAARLAAEDGVGAGQTVLHLSGLLDHTVLVALFECGAALGSFHPLQTIADPAMAAGQLRGAYAGVEGQPAAVARGERLAERLGMTAVPISAEAKPLYHAAASLVANGTVTLAGIGERLAESAGIPRELAHRMYLPLLEGAVANLAALGPEGALTGAVRRGDARTIIAHMGALDCEDQHLYRCLGLMGLRLARAAGLDEVKARYVEGLLSEEP